MHYESAIMVWCVGAKKKLKVGSPNKIILYSLYDFGPSLSVDPKLLLKEGVVKVTKASYLQDIGNFDPSPLLVKLTLPLLEGGDVNIAKTLKVRRLPQIMPKSSTCLGQRMAHPSPSQFDIWPHNHRAARILWSSGFLTYGMGKRFNLSGGYPVTAKDAKVQERN